MAAKVVTIGSNGFAIKTIIQIKYALLKRFSCRNNKEQATLNNGVKDIVHIDHINIDHIDHINESWASSTRRFIMYTPVP